MKNLRFVLCGLVLALFATGAWAVSPKARERGVKGYAVSDLEGGKLVTVQGDGGRELGHLAVRQQQNSLVLEWTEEGGAHLSIEWNALAGRLTVKDLDSGEWADSIAERGARPRPGRDEGGSAWGKAPLLERYRVQIEMAMEALHDVGLDRIELKGGFHKRVRRDRGGEGLERLFGKDEAGISCTGRTVRGNSYFSGTRSGCCQSATDDANFQCWNSYCVGCCSLLSCDAACAVGDYFCICGITGTACAADTPPPPPGGGGGGGGTGGGGIVTCNEGDLVTPEQCVSTCGGYVSGDYCLVP